jgi:hypothetical protein
MTGKILSKLKPLGPLPNDLDEIKQFGFVGDLSIEPEWITDGHAIFLSAGFDRSLLVNQSDMYIKKPKPGSCAKLWADAQKREDVGANILGSMDRDYTDDMEGDGEEEEPIETAILRDELDRIIYADAFKLAFLLYALKVDELTVAKEDGWHKWIRFSRGGELVACLMPKRSTGPGAAFEAGYDIDGPALPLEIEVKQ